MEDRGADASDPGTLDDATLRGGRERDAAATRPRRKASRRRRIRGVATLAVLAAGAVALGYEHRELAGALGLLGRLRWGWVGVAAILEAMSMGPFARLQRWLLRAGGVRLGFWRMVAISLAGNALGTSLPGGAAWSVLWVFRQLRRRGADSALTVWALLTAGVLSGVTLFLLLVGGLWIAGVSGPLRVLRWPAVGVLVVSLLAVLAVVGATSRAGAGLPRERIEAAVRQWRWGGIALDAARELRVRLREVFVLPSSWVKVAGLAAANWLLDLASLVSCILAVRGDVPWRGIVVVYATTEIAASIPLTPGGIGVAEGSLALLLVAYGLRGEVALATVALYRLLSFWGLDALGWAAWAVIAVGERRVARQQAGRDDP